VARPFNITCDAFLNGRILARQPEKGFRSGLDAVFLAALCPAKTGDRVLEAGCGAGVASLCLLARVPGTTATGVEIDPDLADLAAENAALNDAASSFEIVAADVTQTWSELETLGLTREAYDHVIANPPFYEHGRGRPSRDRRNARARAMNEADLDGWLRFLAAAAAPGGTGTVIHTAEALPQLLNAFEGRFGGLRIIPLYPKAGASAIRVVIRGTKGSRAPITIAPGFILHNEDGTQTEAAKAILREGEGLN
jgi:tRNA1(Val) A37 N6-methylase TrmN6